MNNDFELPKVNEEELPKEVEQPQQQEQVEQPQQEVEQLEQQPEQNNNNINNNHVNQEGAGKLVLLTIINALIIFGIHYSVQNYNIKILYALPVVIVVLTIITAGMYKEKNDYPTSLLLSGVLCGSVTFLLSFKLDQDLYTHYAIITAASGILGYIVSASINSLLTKKNKTGMQVLGPIVFLGLLVGVGYYLYNKYPNKINEYLFYNKAEIKASSEEEFISEVLKIRYGQKFLCGEELAQYKNKFRTSDDITQVQNKITKDRRLMTVRYCTDENSNLFTVMSTEYNKSANQYIVLDTYLDNIKLATIRDELAAKVQEKTNAKRVKVFLYPSENCSFYGDCTTNDYFENYEKETNVENQYKRSKELKFDKYLSLEPKQFVNQLEFKYQIFIYNNYRNYQPEQLQEVINNTISVLNESGLKNNSGYIIEAYDSPTEDYQQKMISATGAKGDTFANPEIKVEDSF